MTFLLVGVAVFYTGLANPFMHDDLVQIVDNPTVHSINNIGQFFSGGTFYYGSGHAALEGTYYRPIMTTVFSALYTMFGPNPVPFHVVQVILCVLSTVVLFRLLQYFMDARLSFVLALIFLVHPANSQIAFFIPNMQDPLFFVFGIVALWLLMRFKSLPALFGSAACLILSLLSKETGILFLAMALVQLYWWDRKRLYALVGILALPVVAYIALKANATGLNTNPRTAPIDSLDLGGRLLTMPAILLFYMAKFVWPLTLSSGYFWVHPEFSFPDVVVPLMVDVAVLALLVAVERAVTKKGTTREHRIFCFFAIWGAIGLLAHMQFTPLDITASEAWLYFPMVGFLGMLGIAVPLLAPSPRLGARAGVAMISALVLVLGVRTAVRGTDWSDELVLAEHDLAASPENYSADISVANHLAQQGDLADAKVHAEHAVSVYPNLRTYQLLGAVLLAKGDYPEAKRAFLSGLTYGYTYSMYEQLGLLTVWYGDPQANHDFLVSTLQKLPKDGPLWLDLAILDERHNDHSEARSAVANAYMLGAAGSSYYYGRIMTDTAVTVPDHANFSP